MGLIVRQTPHVLKPCAEGIEQREVGGNGRLQTCSSCALGHPFRLLWSVSETSGPVLSGNDTS